MLLFESPDYTNISSNEISRLPRDEQVKLDRKQSYIPRVVSLRLEACWPFLAPQDKPIKITSQTRVIYFAAPFVE